MTFASSVTAHSLLPSPDHSIFALARSNQSQELIRHFGLFPQALDLSDVFRVLDLACERGDWAVEVARSLEVATLGLEETTRLVKEAQAYATILSVSDLASFEVMKLSEPLAIEDETFDLVHGAFLSERLLDSDWPMLLKECVRVLTPGGVLLLSEIALLSSSSAAGERLSRFCTDALWRLGFGLSTDGNMPGMLHALPTLLHDAMNTQQVEQEIHLLHYRSLQSRYAPLIQSLWSLFHLVQPLLSDMGYGSKEEIIRLCDQFAIDIREESFSAALVLLWVWTKKPQGQPVAVSPQYRLPLLLPVVEL